MNWSDVLNESHIHQKIEVVRGRVFGFKQGTAGGSHLKINTVHRITYENII